MLDRTIPFYNTILRCDDYQHKDVVLPKGFSIEPYKYGYEKAWAELEYAIGDFESLEEAENYFVMTYLQNQELLENILFLVNENKMIIGSCIAWQDKRKDSVVSSLHWLVVDEKYHGIGLGKALSYANNTDRNKTTNILNAEYHMGEFHAYMELIEEISLDKYVEIGEKTKEARETVLEAIDKIYR